MKKKLIFIILIATSLNAQNLKNSVLEILDTNPVVLEKLKKYNISKEDITIAKAGYYPKIDLSLGVGWEKTDKSNHPINDDSSEKFTIYQSSLKYTHNIFNGFQTTYQIKQQEHKTFSAAYSYIETVNKLSFNTVKNYIEILRNRELLEIKKENVTIDEDIFLKVQKLYDSGLTNLSEVNKIESSLALAKSNKVVQENTLLDVTYNMQKNLGRYPDIEKMSKIDINITLPPTLKEATQYAIKNNPSILISNYNIKLAELSYKSSKSEYYPKIDIEISQSINNNLNGVENRNSVFKAMLLLNYNLFNGFTDQANRQKEISKIYAEVELKKVCKIKLSKS